MSFQAFQHKTDKTLNLEIGNSGNYITNISTDSGLTENSDFVLASQKSIKEYVVDQLNNFIKLNTITNENLFSVQDIAQFKPTSIKINSKNVVSVTLNLSYKVLNFHSSLFDKIILKK